jgi:hypothetical protein
VNDRGQVEIPLEVLTSYLFVNVSNDEGLQSLPRSDHLIGIDRR